MPTYEYICTACANEWEEMQKISEPALTDCPKCEQSTAKRQISAGNFILKGGGWYADLYSSTPKKKAEDGATPSAKPEAKSEAKSEGGASSGSSDASSTKSEAAKPAPAPAKSDSKPKS